jgi:hypothetical protein
MKAKSILLVVAGVGVAGWLGAMSYTAYLLGNRPEWPRPDLGYVCPLNNRGAIRYVTTEECTFAKYAPLVAWAVLATGIGISWVRARRKSGAGDIAHSAGKTSPKHSVVVAFKYGLPDLTALRDAEGKIEQAILKAGVGEYDGDEIAVDLADGSLYMYGPDADELYAAIRPVLEAVPFMKGATATLRYGGPADGARTTTIKVGIAH